MFHGRCKNNIQIYRCGQEKQSFCNIVLFILDSEIEEESEEDEDYIPSEDWKKVVTAIFSQNLGKLTLKNKYNYYFTSCVY